MSGIRKHLSRIRKKNRSKDPKKVTILGAGMAGLAAAYELQRLGHEVTLYEASNRVGGRGVDASVSLRRISRTRSHADSGGTRLFAALYPGNGPEPAALHYLASG